MEERLRAGRLKIVGFFDRVRVVEVLEADVRRVADPEIVFMNVNTPDELARARALDARRAG
jgi:molybdopterin-guanine dinucleotide biosynthesis protein A